MDGAAAYISKTIDGKEHHGFGQSPARPGRDRLASLDAGKDFSGPMAAGLLLQDPLPDGEAAGFPV